jgi:hypothetical protein
MDTQDDRRHVRVALPVSGRKPKEDGQKRNRVKPVHDWTEVTDPPCDGVERFEAVIFTDSGSR